MATKRRSKYKRVQENKPLLNLSDGDLSILEIIWRYRYITTPMLSILTGRIPKIINERTHKLWQHGYLGRLHFPHTYTGGSSPSIHVIDDKGRSLLARQLELPLSEIGSSPMTQKNPEMHLKHSLLVSHVYTMVEAACLQLPKLELMFWQRENNKYRERVLVQGRKYTVKPDGFFGILDKSREAGRQRLYFFLEADRSSMKHSDMVRKYQGYMAMWHKYRRQPIPAFDGIKSYRVLTVIEKDSDRLPHLLEDAYKATESGQGSNMFWFVNQTNLPLEKPEQFFAPIWRIGKKGDNERHSLRE
jgi:hypothetical protein